MSIAKIQSGDKVKIIAGNYRGTIGEIIKVTKSTKTKKGNLKIRAAVSNVPKITKYRKSSSFQGQKYPGVKTEVDRLIDVSNLSLLTSDSKLSKVKIVLDSNSKKSRVLKKNEETVPERKIIKKVKSEK